MKLNIISDQYVRDEAIQIIEGICKEEGLPFTGVRLCEGSAPSPVLTLGSPKHNKDLVHVAAPSVRQILNTAGGVTKLRWALIAAAGFAPEIPEPKIVIVQDSHDLIGSFSNGQPIIVDIETSGNADTDAQTDLLCVGMSEVGSNVVYVLTPEYLATDSARR